MSLTSIIILTLNNLESTKLCLESIREYTSVPYELILVDNGSSDGTIEYLNQLADIQLVVNKKNRGFAGGCNQGIALSKGEQILLLNNDTVVSIRWLDNLLKALNSDDSVGITGPLSNWTLPNQFLQVGYSNLYEYHAYAHQFNNHDPIDSSSILQKLELKKSNYILVTAHRTENVDNEKRLKNIIEAFHLITKKHQIPVVCSIHPRTRDRMKHFGISSSNPLIIFNEPFGFFDFVHLQKNAKCVITDSGTVQEESCIFGIPTVTIRRSTERPETIICGSNILAGLDPNRILECVTLMLESNYSWECPNGYMDPIVSNKIINIILGRSLNV